MKKGSWILARASGALSRRNAARLTGTSLLFALLALIPRAYAQTFSTLYSFQCVTTSDGAYPYGDLIADSAGNLYGTTQAGGEFGYGTAFEISPGGTETVLHSFSGPPNDGAYPYNAGLVRDASGNLYGTTSRGGVHDQGTVYELSAQGVETVLHSFFENKRDGAYPYASLLLDGAGDLYGTTSAGGTLFQGTVFRISGAGTENVLYSFDDATGVDGEYPESVLIRDNAGDLYGTTAAGGPDNGLGTVFEVGKLGAESALHSFSGPPDGEIPLAGLVRDAAGNLYGTTTAGGQTAQCPEQLGQGCGTIFKVTPAGQETLLYTFTGGADGGVPHSGLVMDPKGNLYGTASQGGSSSSCNDGGAQFVGCGVVFEINTTGRERVLYSFNRGTDGAAPYGGLLYYKGTLYGTTTSGGTVFGCGTVFKVTP